jgi:hypothetical protein
VEARLVERGKDHGNTHTILVPEDDEEGGVSPSVKRYGPRKRGEKVGCGWAGLRLREREGERLGGEEMGCGLEG